MIQRGTCFAKITHIYVHPPHGSADTFPRDTVLR